MHLTQFCVTTQFMVLDVRDLLAKTGSTYDPGYSCTGSCSSGITFINGGAGIVVELTSLDQPAAHFELSEESVVVQSEPAARQQSQVSVSSGGSSARWTAGGVNPQHLVLVEVGATPP